MKSRWMEALVKTVIFLVVAHVVFLILGLIFRKDIGWFNLPMVWAHWSRGIGSNMTAVISAAAIYVIVYFFCTSDEDSKEQKIE